MRSERVRLASGLQLNYVEEGRSGGEVLLFLHGWPDSWFTFSKVLPRLPPDMRSIALDCRGFGDSERPESGYAIASLAEDAAALLDALSLERATIVGHSMGTFVARRMALAYPERVSRLVLIATGLSPVCRVLLEARTAIADLQDPLPLEFVRDFQSGTAYVSQEEAFMGSIVAESHKAPVHIWRDALQGLLAYDDSEQLALIGADTLLIWGDRDVLFETRQEQERIAAIIPRAALRVYAETGHCPNWERPERVAADITSFVQSHPASALSASRSPRNARRLSC